jgi:hypothetical protein
VEARMNWPTAITIAAYVAAFASIPKADHGSYFPDIAPVVMGITYLGLATIVSLAAWLVWALV